MLKRFKTLIDGILSDDRPSRLAADEVRIACAALLVHCARADGHQSAEEDARLREVLAGHYQLDAGDVEALIADAEAREAETIDLHKLTWVLHQNLDRDGRLEVVRLLWEISHADRNIDYAERTTVNLIAGMLDVEVADAVALRQEVERRRE